MSVLIDPLLLNRPEIKAAFPPTARKLILLPIINYINMLSNLDSTQQNCLDQNLATLQGTLEAVTNRVTEVENTIKPNPADAMPNLLATPVSISATNLANIGLLASNENDDRKTLNSILSLLRLHKWIKP